MKMFIIKEHISGKIVLCYINMEGKNVMNQMVPCWEYFHCPKDICDTCSVYKISESQSTFVEGWFLFDTLKGGPGLHGPCYNCEMVKRTYTNIADLFDDVPSKDQRISTETEPSSNEV
jgi:hypothetical protein